MDLFTAIMALGATAILIGIVLYVLYVIANWKIFVKAGEGGWKSIIPIYNMYIQFKISWNTTMFWVVILLSVISGVIVGLVPDNNIAVLVADILVFVGAIIALIAEYYLCKSFGKGAGFFVGMLITSFFGLSWIFSMILGFGSAQYIGPKGEQR